MCFGAHVGMQIRSRMKSLVLKSYVIYAPSDQFFAHNESSLKTAILARRQ